MPSLHTTPNFHTSPRIPQHPSTSSCINTTCKEKTCDLLLKFLVLCRGVGEGKQKTKRKQKNKGLCESRCKGRTLNPNSHPVGVLPFSSKFKNRSFLRLQPEPSSLNRHHSYKTASIPTSGECAIDRVLRFSPESVQTHGATNLRSATFPFTLQFA
jgi:hypothetical protein